MGSEVDRCGAPLSGGAKGRRVEDVADERDPAALTDAFPLRRVAHESVNLDPFFGEGTYDRPAEKPARPDDEDPSARLGRIGGRARGFGRGHGINRFARRHRSR
jgi:hypothetical protein